MYFMDAFELFRSAALNGRDLFATQDDQLKRNQFGAVIGGPIEKDKLFFFAGYQGNMIHQAPSTTTEFVPAAATMTVTFPLPYRMAVKYTSLFHYSIALL